MATWNAFEWVLYLYDNSIISLSFGYSNGDAGIDMTLSGIAKAIRETGITEDLRTLIAHSVYIRDDQLDQYRANKILSQYMPNHIWMYGDVYKKFLEMIGLKI